MEVCCLQKLKVAVVDVAGTDKDAITEYIIQVNFHQMCWVVYRRYSEFRKLRADTILELKRSSYGKPGYEDSRMQLKNYPFPRRHVVSSKHPTVIEKRRGGLDQFLSHYVSCLMKVLTAASNYGFQTKIASKHMYKKLEEFLLMDAFTYLNMRISGRQVLARIKQRQADRVANKKLQDALKQEGEALEKGDEISLEQEIHNIVQGEKSDDEITLDAASKLRDSGLDERDTKIVLDVISRLVRKASNSVDGAYVVSKDGTLKVDSAHLVNEIEKLANRRDQIIRDAFRSSRVNEYELGPALDSFVSMKWQNCSIAKSTNSNT